MRSVYACLLALLVLAVIIGGCLEEEDHATEYQEEMNFILHRSITLINDELTGISQVTDENAMVLSILGLDNTDALDSLKQSLQKYPYARSSLVIDADGVVIAAVPEKYTDTVGLDLSYQPAVERANTEQQQIVSDVFWLVEGFYGISQSSPIFSRDGQYLGYTDITYQPEVMIEQVITPLFANTPYDVWVVETNGRVIYDTTPEEIGRNLFSDPVYQLPGLQEVFFHIVSETSGKTEYTFWDRNWQHLETKTAVWGTAGVYGAEWRIVITRVIRRK
ncbi:MAG: hypothetical protein D5R96_02820 [Methanocalculus sp. MSAO_Arc2]|uniref:cache domain-containing protein n=1 Tax=Methanocalculus sp. MSAO_Arc2 TaxID=2293855 RepID=UPI000FF7DA60|nr:MAG: hypothetical protein D5R96_02820 [Methanocalculus sp. MSAO_Arc2]